MTLKSMANTASSQSSVLFTVVCSSTKPGQHVCVVGEHAALGGWRPLAAVPLETGPDTFPKWSARVTGLPSYSKALEYKFIIRAEDSTGSITWESFDGNRSVRPEAGVLVTADCVWGDPKSVVNSKEEDAPTAAKLPDSLAIASDQSSSLQRQAREETMLRMAESGIATAMAEVADACPLAVSYADREPRRRNFSQSLLDADIEVVGAAEQEDTRGLKPSVEADAIQTKTSSFQRQASPPGEMQFRHCMSLSALELVASEEEKAQARTGSKAQRHYDPHNLDVPVVIVTSEVAPWSKTGGLGLVAASYSYEFPRSGHRTMTVSPKYRHYDDISLIGETDVWVDGRQEHIKYWHNFVEHGDGHGCDHIFVDHPSIERDGGLYNDNGGREYGDNLFRFTLLCLAAMEAPLILPINNRIYGEKVIFLANDWQAGLVPLYLSYKYRREGKYQESRAIYVVHNLGYQGQYPHVDACRFFGVDGQAACDLAFGKCVNLSKGALICSDRVLTVSPNYAKEIQTPQGGFNLQDFVRAKNSMGRLGGILNGIDDCWNPSTDANIAVQYSVADFLEGKRANKAALQRTLDLREDAGSVVIGFVGRLTWQKGVDVMGQTIEWLMKDTGNGVTGHAQLIMMGNGEGQHCNTLRCAENSYKGRVCGYVGFDPKVEHQMMAGCDLFLMPSRYEPCGLPQMYSQQYGTLPIVTATGGLVDSVRDFSEGLEAATGFHVSVLEPAKLKEVMYKAMELYLKRPADFQQMQRNAMESNFFWPRAVDEYERSIDTTLHDAPTSR